MAEEGAARMFFPAGEYRHPPAGTVQLRVVRGGSSYAEIDLGSGLRRVFTRPGDLLLSLPDRPTLFRIEEPRELTIVTVGRERALCVIEAAGGSLDKLAVLTERPMRDPLLAELCRRLEDHPPRNSVVREWTYGVLFAGLVRLADRAGARHQPPVLAQDRFNQVLAAIDANIGQRLSVEYLAEVSGLPTRSFTAAFRGMTGLPVHQFVLRRRADKATDLISRSDIPLAEVAHLAGFAHQAHMNRVVARLKGRSPGRLRLEARKNGLAREGRAGREVDCLVARPKQLDVY